MSTTPTAVDPKANREAWDNLRREINTKTKDFLGGFENKTEGLVASRLLLDISKVLQSSLMSYGSIVLIIRFLADTIALQAEVEDKFGPYAQQNIEDLLRSYGLDDGPEDVLKPTKLM